MHTIRALQVKVAALEHELHRMRRLLEARGEPREAYKDLELDDFDEDELGIDPEEGL